jgi:hypothetical protein
MRAHTKTCHQETHLSDAREKIDEAELLLGNWAYLRCMYDVDGGRQPGMQVQNNIGNSEPEAL